MQAQNSSLNMNQSSDTIMVQPNTQMKVSNIPATIAPGANINGIPNKAPIVNLEPKVKAVIITEPQKELEKPLEVSDIRPIKQPIADQNKKLDIKPTKVEEESIISKISKEKHKELIEHAQMLLQNLNKIAIELAQNLVDNEKTEDENLSKLIIDLMMIKKDLDNCVEDLKSYPFEKDQETFENIKKLSIAVKKVNQFYDSHKKNLKSYKDFRILVFDLLERSGISIPEKSDAQNGFNFEFDEKSQEQAKSEFEPKFDFHPKEEKLDSNFQWDSNTKDKEIILFDSGNRVEVEPIAINNQKFNFEEPNHNSGFNFNEVKSTKNRKIKETKTVKNENQFENFENPFIDNNNPVKDAGEFFPNFGSRIEIPVNQKKESEKKYSLAKIEYIPNFQEQTVAKRDQKFDQLEKLRFTKERDQTRFELENLVRQYNRQVSEFKTLKVKNQDSNKEYENLLSTINENRIKANEWEFKNENQTLDNENMKRQIDNLTIEQRTLKDKFERLNSESSNVVAKADQRTIEALKIEQDPQIKRLENNIENAKAEFDKMQSIYKKAMNKYQNATNEVTKGRVEQMKKETSQILEETNIEKNSRDFIIPLKKSNILLKNSMPLQFYDTNLKNSQASTIPYMTPLVDGTLLYTPNESISRSPVPKATYNDKSHPSWALLEKSRQLRESNFELFDISSIGTNKFGAIAKSPAKNEWLSTTEAKLAEISDLNKVPSTFGNGLLNERFGALAQPNLNYISQNFQTSNNYNMNGMNGISNGSYGVKNFDAAGAGSLKKSINLVDKSQYLSSNINNSYVLSDYEAMRNKYKINMGDDASKLNYLYKMA